MKRSWIISVAGLLAFAAATIAPAQADIKIGVVNAARLLQESPQAKTVQDALRAEFAPKQRELAGQQARRTDGGMARDSDRAGAGKKSGDGRAAGSGRDRLRAHDWRNPRATGQPGQGGGSAAGEGARGGISGELSQGRRNRPQRTGG